MNTYDMMAFWCMAMGIIFGVQSGPVAFARWCGWLMVISMAAAFAWIMAGS